MAISRSPFDIASFYKLCLIGDCSELKTHLHRHCTALGIKGTIILAEEGINGALAGTSESIQSIADLVSQYPGLEDVEFKLSHADFLPFAKLKVVIKPEVITFRDPQNRHTKIANLSPERPALDPGEYLDSERWDQLLLNPAALILDTRNDYEFTMGHFQNAINPRINHFSELIEWISDNLTTDGQTDRPIGMYCTGGIRCEKSTAYLKSLGFSQVYHLQGGIIKYLETKAADGQVHQGQNLWQGQVFVFDDRIALDANLCPVSHGSEAAPISRSTSATPPRL